MASGHVYSDAELIGALHDLAGHLVLPDAGPVRSSVRARVVDEDKPDRREQRQVATRRRALVVAAVLVLAASAVLAALPSTRDAVADFFGLRGVQIDQQHTPAHPPTGSSLDLGAPVDLDEARRRVSFDVALPSRDRLGAPDAAYVGDVPRAGRITLAYAPRSALPATATTGVGLLLTEFHADIPEPVIRKSLAAGTGVEQVAVDGAAGYWFSGAPHVLTLADADGQFFTDRSRLAGNTLLWQRGSVTYRLESSLTRDEAIRIAESLSTDHGSSR
ncbi:MAG: hypothetical protein QOF40_2033 [Actinomycetota bacterium]|nr:hypothetical protein [Actinomycetota bacterium]